MAASRPISRGNVVARALLALGGVAILVIPILFVLIAALGGSGSAAPAATAGQRKSVEGRLSPDEVKYLSALGFTALFIAALVGASAGPGWAVLPVGIWLVILLGMRYRARPRVTPEARLPEAPNPRENDNFGKDGVALLERADNAVAKVLSSNAVKDGWLGPANRIDLRSDVRIIEDRLKRVSGIRQVMKELSRIPNPADDDLQRTGEAKSAEAKLLADARNRVERLEKLAREVQATDHDLRLRSLTDVDDDYADNSSGTVDLTQAMLSAYREVKGLSEINDENSRKGSRPEDVRKPQENLGPGLLATLKQWWSS
jgi:hypothetical protein